MSASIPYNFNDLHPQLVLSRVEQDSAQMAQKICARDPERLLRDVPRKRRERRRKRQGIYRQTGLVRRIPTLQTMGREVVRIASTPRRLRPCTPRCLAGRRGARPLTSPHTSVGHEPATTDAARALPEHPPMLYASRMSGGPLLPSRPRSILESGEATVGEVAARCVAGPATDSVLRAVSRLRGRL